MKRISRSHARDHGLVRYFTGKPCRNGHTCERWTIGGGCVECHKELKVDYKAHSEFCKRYEKTKKGFLVRAYRNMQSRINGTQKGKHHLYRGLALLDRQDFYDWALSSDKFHRLFAQYEQSGYDRKLAPSVDRLDSGIGYEIENMEWVTHSENSRRGANSRWSAAMML